MKDTDVMAKIDKEYKKMMDEVDNTIKSKRHHSNFNFNNPHYYLYCEQLRDYLEKEIIYVYVLAKNAELEPNVQMKDLNKEMYGNMLCRNICSFIDLYLQFLNILYDLELDQLRKDFNLSMNSDCGIVDQAISGNINTNKYNNVISWSNVQKKIEGKYTLNKYYIGLKEIIKNNNDIKAMKLLRNYSVHNQALFSRFVTWYSKEQIVTEINPEEELRQYDKFIKLAHRAIKAEINLVIYFEDMCYDKKMIPKNEHAEEMCIFECANCRKRVTYSKNFKKLISKKPKLKMYCDNCKNYTYLNDLNKTIKVHPERYYNVISQDELPSIYHAIEMSNNNIEPKH